MHCELVVPGLFAGPPLGRLPALELLLARGRCTSRDSERLEAWLAAAYELESLPAGALTLLGAGGEPGEGWWLRADPVHLQFVQQRMVLAPAAALRIGEDEARALCSSLNAHFGGRLALQLIDATRWVARTEGRLAAHGASPMELAGRDVDLAGDSESAGCHQLLNEAQMLLHSHAVNEARESRGEPAINSLWLWGAGAAPHPEVRHWASVSADDPLLLGLARAAGARGHRLAADGSAWLAATPEEGRHLVLLDRLRAPLALGEAGDYHDALAALERDWFAPLLAALRDGRTGMVTLHVPDGPQCSAHETIRGDLRRFWRRRRALEHYS